MILLLHFQRVMYKCMIPRALFYTVCLLDFQPAIMTHPFLSQF